MFVRVSTALVATLLLGYSCLSQASEEVSSAMGAAVSLHEGLAEPRHDAGRATEYVPSMRELLKIFVADAGAGQFEAGAGVAVAQRGKWQAFIGIENYTMTGAELVDASRPVVGVVEATAAAAARARISNIMSPIAASRQRFRQFTELRLRSTDVLMSGDSLTLRAGSDLRFLLQGIGISGWADDAAALVGWRSRIEMRWARPTSVGEFSFFCRVDRRANELGRGQVVAHWEARL